MSTHAYAYDESVMLASIRAWKAETPAPSRIPPTPALTFTERPAKSRGIALADAIEPEDPIVRRKPPIRPAKLISIAAEYFKVSEMTLKSHYNSPIAVTRRHVCWLILHQVGYSLPIIGRAFSYAGRDYHHTTVMHGITRAKARLVCDAEFKAAYDALVEMAG